MITLFVDEAYAFDYLSILKVKEDLLKKTGLSLLLEESIKQQIGNDTYSLIVQSDEFKRLYSINSDLFLAVEKVRLKDTGNRISARYMDELNMERHRRKILLQSKFFQSPVTEHKTQ